MEIITGCLVALLLLIAFHCAAMGVWWRRIDRLDRLSVVGLYRGKRSSEENKMLYRMSWRVVRRVLALPYMPRDYMSRVTEGHMYNMIPCWLANNWPETNDKMYWARLFERHNIMHPEILMYNERGNIVIISEPDPTQTYILKPLYAACGLGISKIQGAEAREAVKTPNVLIQSLLRDCRTDNVRHFRVVTLRDSSVFNITELNAPSTAMTSNHTRGASGALCANCPIEVSELSQKLATLHEAELSVAYSIGWDVMLHCEGDNYTAYCLEGNLYHGTWFPETLTVDPEMMDRYKDGLREYLRQVFSLHV